MLEVIVSTIGTGLNENVKAKALVIIIDFIKVLRTKSALAESSKEFTLTLFLIKINEYISNQISNYFQFQ